MNIRRIIIIFLTCLLVGIIIFGAVSFTKPYDMKIENLTIHESPNQTESKEHPDFVVEEYVSELPEGENIALEGKVSASNFADVYTPMKVIDGSPDGGSYWEAAADSYPNTLVVEFEEAKPIHGLRIRLCPDSVWGKRRQTFEVAISDDGENYITLIPMEKYEFNPNLGNEVILIFDEVNARYVKISFTQNTGASGAQVAEFEIYSK